MVKDTHNRKISIKPSWLFAITSALLAFLAYGVFLRELGMYGDDPNFLWAYHRGGAAEFRPFMAWIRDFGYLLYQFLSPFFGENILVWRAVTLFLRWTSCLLFYFTLAYAFPEQKLVIRWAALLFLLYPGFLQQAIPVEFVLHFTSLNLILGSILLMQLAYSGRRYRWVLLAFSFPLQIAGLFLCEYFISLEMVRPVLLIRMLEGSRSDVHPFPAKPQKKSIALRHAWPLLIYGMIFLGYLIWRGFFADSTYLEPVFLERLQSDFGGFFGGLISQVLRDLKLALVQAWTLPFSLTTSGKTFIAWLMLVVASFFIGAVSSFVSNPPVTAQPLERKTLRPLLLLGLYAAVCGGIPVWAAGLRMELALFWDSLTLSFMWGACLTFAAIIGSLIRRRYQPLLFSLFIAVLVGYQFQLQNQYRRDWQQIQNFFWQLQWRAPDLEAGTLVLGDQFPFSSITDNSLNALLNWNYESQDHPQAENYKFFQVSARRGWLIEGSTTNKIMHNQFSGDLSHSIVVYATPSTCLKVLTTADRDLPFLGNDLRKVLEFSDPGRILAESSRNVTFQSFMGSEPAHNWCYYYEKSELAAQQGRWDETLRLGKEAESLGFVPTTMIEMRPFLFGALFSNDLETGRRWAEMALQEKGNADYYLRWINRIDTSGLNGEALQLLNWLKAGFETEINSE